MGFFRLGNAVKKRPFRGSRPPSQHGQRICKLPSSLDSPSVELGIPRQKKCATSVTAIMKDTAIRLPESLIA